MRNYLTTSDIARLSDHTPAQVRNWDWHRAGSILRQQASRSGKQMRFVDEPIVRALCEVKRRREDPVATFIRLIGTIVLATVARDLTTFIRAEILEQLRESEHPSELLKKWERAIVDGHAKDFPRIEVTHARSEVLAEIFRQLVDSQDPEQLFRKWLRAVVDQRPDDLPRVP